MFDFGLLQPFVEDELITDIDSNAKTVYVTHQYKGHYRVLELEENYLFELINKLSNTKEINEQFNFEKPILDGELKGLRIHAEHPSFVTSGATLSIRKNPLKLVITEANAHEIGFCNKKLFQLIKMMAQMKMSVIFGGEVGTGKTQIMKTFLSLTDENASIVFISDIDEMRMTELYPLRCYRQCITNRIVGYRAITSSVLRDNVDYICFQEVRDSAVDDLFLALSSSSRVTGTVHLKNALLMPQRLIQLSCNKNDERLLSTIHDYIQMCIVPHRIVTNGVTKRYIGEVAMFWNENGVPKKTLIYEHCNDSIYMYDLPDYFKKYFAKQNIKVEWSEEVEKI